MLCGIELINPESMMAADKALFEDYEKQIHRGRKIQFYQSPTSWVSFGYPMQVDRWLDLDRLVEKKIPVIRRPTGGGVVLHEATDLILSLATDYGSAAYFKDLSSSLDWMGAQFLNAFHKLNLAVEMHKKESSLYDPICFSHTRSFEISFQKQKILGLAQRRGRNSLLIQASIALAPITHFDQNDFRREEDWQNLKEASGYLNLSKKQKTALVEILSESLYVS